MLFFFFQAEDGIRDYKVTGVQTCALPISGKASGSGVGATGDGADGVPRRYGGIRMDGRGRGPRGIPGIGECGRGAASAGEDRKSTRLNSSHLVISYAVFCLKKKIIVTDSSPLAMDREPRALFADD